MGLGVGVGLALGRGPFGGGGAFSPKNLPGLTAWFDASQITGVANGASLATWGDESGNGNDATQSTAGDQPTYYSSTAGKTVNGLPSVWWTNSSVHMATAAFSAALSTGTIFAVLQFPPSSTLAYAYDGISGTNRWALGNLQASPVAIEIYQGGTVVAGPTSWSGFNQFTAFYTGGASSFLRMNGTSYTAGNAGSATLTGLMLGARYDASSNDYPDAICEIILCSGILSAANYQATEAYLKSKWGTP